MNEKKNRTQSLVFTSILLAMGIVINTLLKVPGSPIRISLGNPFLRMIPILFGPAYGGISFLLNDLLSFIMKPDGGIIIWLTLVEVVKGVAIGFLWKWFKETSLRKAEVAFGIFWMIPLVLSAVGLIFGYGDGSNQIAVFFSTLDSEVYGYLAVVLILCIVNLFVFIYGRRAYKEKRGFKDFRTFLILMLVVGIPCLIGTVVNTGILQRLFFKETTFFVLLVPRVIKEFIMTVYSAYVIAFMLRLYERINKSVA